MLYTFIEVFLVTILPVFFLESGIVDYKYRIYTFGACFLLALVSIIYRQISTETLGFRQDNFGDAIQKYGLLTIVLLVLMLFVFTNPWLKNLITPKISSVLTPWQYLLISVPIQQFIYFGYLNAVLKSHTQNKFYIALVIGVLFSLMHLPWRSTQLTILTLVVGVVWGFLYTLVPNLFVSTATHMLLGGALLLIHPF